VFGRGAISAGVARAEGRTAGEQNSSEQRQASGEEQTLGIAKAELHRLAWTAEVLKCRWKGDAKNVRTAQRLRADRTMTLKSIAAMHKDT